MLDFNGILENCGYGKDEPPSVILANIAKLEEFYSSDELVQIYNYFLLNIKNFEVLKGIVKNSSLYKSNETLSILLNILLKKEETTESDEYTDLRVACAKVISEYKDASTLKDLLHCLNDKNENYKIRLACADALGRIGDSYAVKPLIDVVQDENEKSVYVKESATFALGLIGDTSAIDPLVAIMDAKQGIWDKFTFLKEKIVEVLGMLNINNDKVLRVLKNSLMDVSPMVRINAIEALMNSEYEEAPELIRKALHDEDYEVCRNALVALYNIEGRDILEEVISLPCYSDALKQEAENIIKEYEE